MDTYFVKIVAINAVEVAHVSVSLGLESSADKECGQIKVETVFLSLRTHITQTILFFFIFTWTFINHQKNADVTYLALCYNNFLQIKLLETDTLLDFPHLDGDNNRLVSEDKANTWLGLWQQTWERYCTFCDITKSSSRGQSEQLYCTNTLRLHSDCLCKSTEAVSVTAQACCVQAFSPPLSQVAYSRRPLP